VVSIDSIGMAMTTRGAVSTVLLPYRVGVQSWLATLNPSSLTHAKFFGACVSWKNLQDSK
jgi:hypothetical protein